MAIVFDFILLAASASAALYCFVLSGRLKELRNTETGIGATIASMSKTVDEARGAVVLAKKSSADSVTELTPLIDEARQIVPQLNDLVDVISELADIATADINKSCAESSAVLDAKLLAFSERITRIESRISQTEAKMAADVLNGFADELDPGAIYVDDGEQKAPASAARGRRVGAALDRANAARAAQHKVA